MKGVFEGVLDMTLTGSLVILVVLLARLALSKAPKRFSYVLWAAVLIRLLCPVGIPVRLPQAEIPVPVSISSTIKESTEVSRENVQKPQVELPKDGTQTAAQQMPEKTPLSWEAILAAVWAVGGGAMLLFGCISNFRFRRQLQEAYPIADNLYIADHIGSAFVVGLFRPKIYLDSRISGERMQYIVAHEQTHIRRWDHVTRHLAYAALCIHWFNPLVWLAFVLSGRDMEMSCDESVIEKMGPQVRSGYSESLVNLAMGKHILADRPIAFGEGDTRRRVMNIAKWKRTSKKVSVMCVGLCLAVLALCACEPTKIGDGNDKPLVQTVQKNQQKDVKLQKNDVFTSDDGTVEYQWNLDETLTLANLPVVEAVPRQITGEDAQELTKAVYGDSAIYDIGADQQRTLTQKEIQREIDFLTTYLDPEKLADLPVSDDTAAEPQSVQPAIEELQARLASAPQEITNPLWNGTVSEIASEQYPFYTLNAFGYIGENPYQMTVQHQDSESQVLDELSIYLSDGGDVLTPQLIGQAQLCATEPPTQEMVDQLVKRCQEKLDQAAPGKWQVVGTRVREEFIDATLRPNGSIWKDATAYHVYVDVMPLVHGVPGILWPASDYYLYTSEMDSEDYILPGSLTFHFNANGVLAGMVCTNPVEEVRVVEDSAELLPMELLMEKAQQQLSRYGSELMQPWNVDGDSVVTKVEINRAEFGLAQTPAKDHPGHFYQVPAVCFRGDVNCYDGQTGELLGSETYGAGTLVTVNAIDGTIIG